MHPGEQSFPVWSAFGALDDALSALCGPGDFKPVRPERTELERQERVAKLQVGEMRRGFSCPTCGDGLVGFGDAQCKRCMDEDEEES